MSFYNSASKDSELADSGSAEVEISAKDLEAPVVESAEDNSPASIENSAIETKNDGTEQSEENAAGSLAGKKVESAEEVSAGAFSLMEGAAQTPAMAAESAVATKTATVKAGIAGVDGPQHGAQRGNNAVQSWYHEIGRAHV